jgi:hypothetical protein
VIRPQTARAPDTLCASGAVQINGRSSCLLSRTDGRVNLQKLLGLIVIALLLFFVFTRPAVAGGMVVDGLGLLRDGAERISTFFTTIV